MEWDSNILQLWFLISVQQKIFYKVSRFRVSDEFLWIQDGENDLPVALGVL
jgi:hypothetical protein